MKIAVFGTGIVGQVISVRLTGLGHSVIVGTRDVAKTLVRTGKDMYGNPPFGEWYEQNKSSVRLATYKEAAASSEIVFNCTMGQGSIDALKQAGDNINGKIIIDTSNPLDFSKGAPPSLSPGNTDSLGELIQRTFPEAKVVKTLNTMNCFLMVNPGALAEDHNVFVSGNDVGAKSKAKEILNSFGWKDANIIELGDITTARGTEQLLPIWIRLYTVLHNPMFNFKIVIGPAPKM
jgi:8-hydroxy-5-deazaflavin:NADPH oxidoreductase